MFRLEKVEVSGEEPAAEPVEALDEALPPPERAPEKADLFTFRGEDIG
jgi:hypothetical protein